MRFNASRRNIVTAGLGLVAVAVVGCTRAVHTRTVAAPVPSPSNPAPVQTASPPSTPERSTPETSTPAPPATARSSTLHSVAPVSPSTTPTTPAVSRTTASRPLGPARQVAAGPTDRPQVALTFHGAGDISYAREILRIAKAKKAHITVMAVGTWLADNPQMGREILAGGHDIGNHTLSHIDINSLPKTQMRSEVVGCRDILQRTTGTPGSYFRQSQSQTANPTLLEVAGQAGYHVCLSYNLDSMDWTDPGAQAVRDNVALARPGSIVSMHLGHSGTVTALPGILDDLGSRGLSAVTVTTLLAT